MNAKEKCIELNGNTSLLLDQQDVRWLVQTGSVAVFAVALEDGQRVGPREYLMTCCAGEMIFGCEQQAAESNGIANRVFLAVSLEQSRLVKFAISDPEVQQDRTKFAQGLQRWVQQLSGVLKCQKASLASATALESGIAQLGVGSSIAAPIGRIGWIRIHSGRLLLEGKHELGIGPGLSWIPLSHGLVMTVEHDSQLEYQNDLELELAHQLGSGVQMLHSLCFRYLELQQREALDRHADLIVRRHDLQCQDTVSAIGEMSFALTAQADERPNGDMLFNALTEIGSQLNLDFDLNSEMSSEPLEERVMEICRSSRIRLRRVRLRSEWWCQDAGPLLGTLMRASNPVQPTQVGAKEQLVEVPVALIFSGGRYSLYDSCDGSQAQIDSTIEKQLSRDAFTFIRPLPDEANSLVALGRFMLKLVSSDMTMILSLSLAVTLLGMLLPLATRLVVDAAIPDADLRLLMQLAFALFAMSFGQAALSFARSNLLLRVSTLSTAGLQAAIMDRLVRLPARFFRDYSTGDLQNRAMMISEISHSVGYSAIGGILTGGLAAINLVLCFYYSPSLALIALCSALMVAGYTTVLSLGIRKTARALSLSQGKLFGLQVQLVSSVAKLQVAGAEQLAFNFWARQQAKLLGMKNSIHRAEQWSTLINAGLTSCATIVLYYFAVTMLVSDFTTATLDRAGKVMLTVGTFLAFYVAFQSVIQGVTGLSATLVDVCDSWAKRKLVEPILQAQPEDDHNKVDPGLLDGRIAVRELSFRYYETGPLILKDINLQAAAGEFIAIVGASGSGKSTLLRNLLGFETPESGTISFDGQSSTGLNRTAVRRQMGVVLQSGRINAGSLYDNISGPARVTLEEAWVAAAAAGFSDDIEHMPMGMHTFINEGGSTLSGGQRQRLLIARALVTQPKILIFDEATSALDNRTQQIVSESLEQLQVTRIVVAHRLSTIRDADRIYVMDNGRIVQSGTFDDLANQEGKFKQMIARQLV